MHSRFVLNSEQRMGVVGLVLIILILSGVIIWLQHQPSNFKRSSSDLEEENLVQNFIDSIKKSNKINRDTAVIFPFNPNFISDYKGYTLGMSPEEIDRLHEFRERDKWVNSAEEFQQITQVSDSLLKEIAPNFKFPEWVEKEKNVTKAAVSNRALSFEEKKDLNTATAEELMEVKGVGEVLSKRITRYRAKLNGFVADLQLKDIYGLNYETRQNILAQFTVKDSESVEKIDLNNAEVSELLEVVYFDYELARKIIDYRITHEGITSFEELAKIDGFPIDRMDQLKLYVEIDP